MRNQVYTGTNVSRRFALCPTTVVSGDPVLIGTIPGVALDSYQANTGGTTFLCNGSFTLTVIAATVVSPITGRAVNPGDKIYATGTLDSVTNITTGLVLSKATGGTLFGHLDPSAGVLIERTETREGVGVIGGSTDRDGARSCEVGSRHGYASWYPTDNYSILQTSTWGRLQRAT